MPVLRVTTRMLLCPTSVMLLAALPLAGCSMQGTADAVAQSTPALNGIIHGGQSPVVGAQIFVLAAGTAGYGSSSNSLLTHGNGSTTLGTYVLSDANGNFAIPSGYYSCMPGQAVYLLSLGGNPGLGAGGSNPALAMVAPLGTCPSADSFSASVPFVTINEVTTIATVFALSGFMTDATHVSSSGSALASVGVGNAFATAANMVSVAAGAAYVTTPSTTNGVVPQSEINTLADILQSCVNSNGDSTTSSPASPCYQLFHATNSVTRPANTVEAALDIAHSPGSNVSTLFGCVPSNGAAFLPSLSAAPNDWTLGITFSDANVGLAPVSMAVDGSGNIWTVAQDKNQVVKYNNLGVPGTSSPYVGFSVPNQIAIDSFGNAWVSNGSAFGPSETNPGVTEIYASGTGSMSYTTGGIELPVAVAVDASNNIWTANQVTGGGNVSHITDAGAAIATAAGPFGGSEEQAVQSVALDSLGDVWTTTGYNVLNRINGSSGSLLSTTTLSSYTLGALAIDSSTNIWVADPVDGILGFSNATRSVIGGSPFTGGGIQNASSVVLDGNDNIWVSSDVPLTSGCTGHVAGITSAGVAITPPSGYTTPALSVQEPGCLYTLVVDGSGNLWYAGPKAITEFVGAATPAHTPITPAALSTRP